METAVLPDLPIVGRLKLESRDGKTISQIYPTKEKTTKLSPLFQSAFKELKRYLEGKTTEIELPLDMTGMTSFQAKVLKEMKKIPYGEVKSYGEIAKAMKSKAFQAIGSACGRNPFMIIYPCHRVVGTNGPGGFAHGPKMKSELLKLEGFTLKS